MKFIFLILITALLISSCKKNYEACDNGQLCVKNVGSGVIHFAWGSNFYTDSILPGEETCIDAGRIDTDPSHESKPIFSFMSDHGDYAIEVESCDWHTTIE